MESPLISVIVPVYNVAPFLDRCVSSLVSQTWPNMEIVLVDDGSPDESGKICDSWTQKAPSVVKVIHKENGGVSSARNAGLKAASGDFIGFVDPDDFVESGMYAFLYNLLEKSGADISVCFWDDYEGDSPEEQVFKPNEKNKEKSSFCDVISASQSVKRELEYGIYITCNKLFSKKSVEGILYKEDCINGEDRLFLIQTLCQSQTVAYDMKAKYHYCHRKNSAGTKPFTQKDLSLLECCEEVCKIVKEKFPESIPAAQAMHQAAYRRLLSMMDKNESLESEYKSRFFIEMTRRYPGGVLKQKSLPAKIKYLLALLFPRLFILLQKLRKK